MSSARSFHSNDPLQYPSDLASHPPSRHPSGLVRLVEATGRTRGSSATPQPPSVLSPTPNRGFQTLAQPNNINNSMNQAPPSGSSSNSQGHASPCSQSSSRLNQGFAVYNRNQTSSTQQSSPAPSHGFNHRNDSSPRVQPSELQNQGSRQSLPLVILSFRLYSLLLTIAAENIGRSGLCEL